MNLMIREDSPRGKSIDPHPYLHKVVSLISTPTTTYPSVISNRTDMIVSQVTDEVLYTDLIHLLEMYVPEG